MIAEYKRVMLSRPLARAWIDWTANHYKVFALCLTHMVWGRDNSNIVELDKEDILEAVGSQTGAHNRPAYARRLCTTMVDRSMVHWSDADRGTWQDMQLFVGCECPFRSPAIRLAINPQIMEHLQSLADYIVTFCSDFLRMQTIRGIRLYLALLCHADSRKRNNMTDYTTRELKAIWGMDADTYVTMHNGDKHFSRTSFEHFALDAAINDMACVLVMPIIYWHKEKKGNNVIRYRICRRYNPPLDDMVCTYYDVDEDEEEDKQDWDNRTYAEWRASRS